MFAVTPHCPALVETPDGPRAIETLAPGSHVTLARGGSARVAWLGQRRLRPSPRLHLPSARPIAISPGALGDCTPHVELRLSPDHAVFAGLFVPIGLLVNGRTIRQVDTQEVRYVHLELDHHDAILAEGLPVETYADTGNRSLFANAPVVALHPRLPAPVPERLFDAVWLDALRARLAVIADGRPQTLSRPGTT